MVDISLDLPGDVLRAYERRGRATGRTAEELMRDVIEAGGGLSAAGDTPPTIGEAALSQEPVVEAADIEKAYRSLGYSSGWRLVTCPWANASRAKLLLVSFNPAGSAAHGPSWSQEEGSAYRIEAWNGLAAGQAPLQRQVQQLFSFLKLEDRDVFSAHYVPFRSPSWSELARKVEAERFAQQLWRWLLPKVSFDRVVCIGKDRPAKPIADMMGARLEASLPVGWGNITADRYRLPDGRLLIALPHLSRFALFGRAAGAASLRELFHD